MKHELLPQKKYLWYKMNIFKFSVYIMNVFHWAFADHFSMYNFVHVNQKDDVTICVNTRRSDL